VSALDRAFLFGDAVYEVLPLYASRAFRAREDLDRLGRALAGDPACPPRCAHGDWAKICRELISRIPPSSVPVPAGHAAAQSSPAITYLAEA